MKTKSHILISLIIVAMFSVSSLLFSQANATSSDWFPLQIGNEWRYTDGFQTFTEKIVDTTRINGKLFYSMAYVGDSNYISLWYRSSNESLYVAIHPSKDTIETLLYDFNGKIGDSITTSVSIFACNFGDPIILLGKNDTVITPSRIYTDCYHFKHHPKHCTDDGLWDSWVAKGVGIVKYIRDNISGAQTYTLVSSKLTTIKQNLSVEFIPKNYLFNNYPNPFNPVTQFEFQIPQKSYVSLKIFDMLGHEVATIVSEEKNEGTYSIQWNASEFSSGVYFATMTAGNFSLTKKLVLVK